MAKKKPEPEVETITEGSVGDVATILEQGTKDALADAPLPHDEDFADPASSAPHPPLKSDPEWAPPVDEPLRGVRPNIEGTPTAGDLEPGPSTQPEGRGSAAPPAAPPAAPATSVATGSGHLLASAPEGFQTAWGAYHHAFPDLIPGFVGDPEYANAQRFAGGERMDFILTAPNGEPLAHAAGVHFLPGGEVCDVFFIDPLDLGHGMKLAHARLRATLEQVPGRILDLVHAMRNWS